MYGNKNFKKSYIHLNDKYGFALKKMNWRDNIETVQRFFYDFENSNKDGVGMAQFFK